MKDKILIHYQAYSRLASENVALHREIERLRQPKKESVMKISKIEISFEAAVEPPEGFFRALDGLVGMICRKYQAENPDRVMWPSGHGSKMLSNPFLVGDDEPLKFDTSVYHLEVTEREDFHGQNPHNPNRDKIQAELAERRKKSPSEKMKDRKALGLR